MKRVLIAFLKSIGIVSFVFFNLFIFLEPLFFGILATCVIVFIELVLLVTFLILGI